MNIVNRVTVSFYVRSSVVWQYSKLLSIVDFNHIIGCFRNNKTFVLPFPVSPASSWAVGVYMKGPQLHDPTNNGHVVITCTLLAMNVEDFSITWRVGGINTSHGVDTKRPVKHSNGTETKISYLTVPAETWQRNVQFSCEAKHPCAKHRREEHISKSKGSMTHESQVKSSHSSKITHVSHPLSIFLSLEPLERPSVEVIQSSDWEALGSNTTTLRCLVSGFFPSDIVVTWEKDGLGLPSSDYMVSPAYKYPGSSTYSTSSRLNVSLTEGHQESTYTCVVKHESSQELLKRNIEHVFGKRWITVWNTQIFFCFCILGSTTILCIIL